MIELSFKTPTEEEFNHVCRLIKEYELDDRNLLKNEFIIALKNGKLTAFGRLKKYHDCAELCSVGVLKTHRNSHIGNELIQFILKQNIRPLYVVCIIPEYFQRFGFVVTENYPSSIQAKLSYCINQLPVNEKYVVMALKNLH
jgi:N-acetylglutamate synthase-like GNAT family acetyltransferase